MPATQAELEAILHGAAFAPLSAPGYEDFARGFLRITGSDATRWLNGMVTNSIQALAPGEGNYNFLLNAQGRILADCTIYREPHENEPTFLLETDSSQLVAVSDTLDRFIIMDDVELTPSPSEGQIIRLFGPSTPDILKSYYEALKFPTFEPPSANQLAHAGRRDRILTTAASSGIAYDVTDPDGTGLLLAWAEQEGALLLSPAALEAFRIFSGTPRYGTDIRNSDAARDLPQETNQTHALHFSKGCYLGQEIVERIRSRGQVHSQFTRFRRSGDLPGTLPARLQADSKPAGELTSAALVPLPGGPQLFALGYARREFLELRRELTYPDGTAIPISASESLTSENSQLSTG